MIKNERLRRGLVVAGAVAAALGGGVGAAQAASGAHELPELGTPVAASGLTSGLDSVAEGNPLLVPPFDGLLTALPIPNPADGLGALAGGGGKK